MAAKTRTVAENATENAEVGGNTTEAEKTLKTANTEATEGTFIYVGPSLNTGLRKNAVFHGTREAVEEHLKGTIEKYPQVKLLIFGTDKYAEAQAKVKKTGTLLNKYYTDLVSLSKK